MSSSSSSSALFRALRNSLCDRKRTQIGVRPMRTTAFSNRRDRSRESQIRCHVRDSRRLTAQTGGSAKLMKAKDAP